ncbi:MAG: hypothetical protein NTV24_04330 [Candidatus Woesebacteria bacterium]|nr:hypothetical protein [Candidatus Woesebacteria bacterium]
MSWLERLREKAKEKAALQEECKEWLENNPEIKKRVDQLNEDSLEHFKKAGIAATVAYAGSLFTPGSWLIMGEYGRQILKAEKKLKERNQVIRKNSPYQQ